MTPGVPEHREPPPLDGEPWVSAPILRRALLRWLGESPLAALSTLALVQLSGGAASPELLVLVVMTVTSRLASAVPLSVLELRARRCGWRVKRLALAALGLSLVLALGGSVSSAYQWGVFHQGSLEGGLEGIQLLLRSASELPLLVSTEALGYALCSTAFLASRGAGAGLGAQVGAVLAAGALPALLTSALLGRDDLVVLFPYLVYPLILPVGWWLGDRLDLRCGGASARELEAALARPGA